MQVTRIGELNTALQKDLKKQYANVAVQKFPPEVFSLLPDKIMEPGQHDFCDFISSYDYCTAPVLQCNGVVIETYPQHWKCKGNTEPKLNVIDRYC